MSSTPVSEDSRAFPLRSIQSWLSAVTPLDFFLDLRENVFGQDEALRKAAILVYGHLSNMASGNHHAKLHFLIEGSSGCGKTTFAKALKETSPIPVFIADASQVTAAGYKGAEVSDLLPSEELQHWNGYGVLILDELDKLMEPSYSSDGKNTHLEALNNLLKLLDGGTLIDRQGNPLDCSRLLVIGMGAFSPLKQKRQEVKPIGFGAAPTAITESSTKTEMTDFCGSEQFLGRFNAILHFEEPNRKVYEEILRQTLRELQQIYGSFRFPYAKSRKIIESAIHENFGCRGIKSAVWEAFLDMDCVIPQSQLRAEIERQEEIDRLNSAADEGLYSDSCA